MQRYLIIVLSLVAVSCQTTMTVPGPALQAAAQICRGSAVDEPDARVYHDRKGRLRIASTLDDDGVPTGKTIVIDHKTKARWDTGWEPVCYGPDSSDVDQLRLRRPDPGTTYGALIGVTAAGVIVSLPFLYLLVCGLHGC